MNYWITKDASKVYVLIAGGYQCYELVKDLFGTQYYAQRGTVTHVPNPEKMFYTKQVELSEIYSLAKARRVL